MTNEQAQVLGNRCSQQARFSLVRTMTFFTIIGRVYSLCIFKVFFACGISFDPHNVV